MTDFIQNLLFPLLFGIGGLVGFAIKVFLDKRLVTSDRIVPFRILVERYDQRRLGEYGKKRLRKQLDHVWTALSDRMRPKPGNWPRLKNWPSGYQIVVRQASQLSATLCPAKVDSEGTPTNNKLLYMEITSDRSALDSTGLAAAVMREIKRYTDEVQHSQLYLSTQSPDDTTIYLWIDAQTAIWSHGVTLGEAVNDLDRELSRSFPAMAFVLEITAAIDVLKDLKVPYDKPVLDTTPTAKTPPNPAARYVALRDQFHDQLQRGFCVWRQEAPKSEMLLPEAILEKRVAAVRALLEDPWKRLTIYGPAGAGKTQTAKRLLQRLAEQGTGIVVEICADDISLGEEAYAEEATIDVRVVLRQMLTDALSRGIGTSRDEITVSSCRDVVNRYVDSYPERIIAFVDDLDNFRQLRGWTTTMPGEPVSPDENGVRMVRVIRAKVQEAPVTTHVEHSFEPFTNDESRQILANNLSHGTSLDRVDELISHTPFAHSTGGMSLYALRIIKEFETPPASPDSTMRQFPVDLLRSTILRIVEPINSHIRGSGALPYDELSTAVERIRTLLEKGELVAAQVRDLLPAPSEFDLVDVLGDLAWYSKYREQEPLGPSSIVHWTGRAIRDEAVAKELLELGMEAGIFGKGRNEAFWRDQLVADGCAVMRMRAQQHDGTVAEMARTLVNGNASEMLWMGSDFGVFEKIVNAVSNGDTESISVLDAILSEQAVAWLAMDIVTMQKTEQRLIELGNRIERAIRSGQLSRLHGLKHLAQLSNPLSRLARKDIVLKQKCCALAGIGDSGDLDMMVVARLFSPQDFQVQFADRGTSARRAAAFTWSLSEGMRLSDWCIASKEMTNSTAREFYTYWCERHRSTDLLDMMMQRVETTNSIKTVYDEPVVSVTLEVLSRRRLPKDVCNRLVATVVTALPQLPTNSFSHSVGAIVRVLELLGRFMEDDLEWIRVGTGAYALSSRPLRPMTVIDALNCLLDRRIRLPKSADLKKCNTEYLGEEWVADAIAESRDFPNDVFGDDKKVRLSDASILQVWNGSCTIPLSRQRRRAMESERLQWRPKIDIKALTN